MRSPSSCSGFASFAWLAACTPPLQLVHSTAVQLALLRFSCVSQPYIPTFRATPASVAQSRCMSSPSSDTAATRSQTHAPSPTAHWLARSHSGFAAACRRLLLALVTDRRMGYWLPVSDWNVNRFLVMLSAIALIVISALGPASWRLHGSHGTHDYSAHHSHSYSSACTPPLVSFSLGAALLRTVCC